MEITLLDSIKLAAKNLRTFEEKCLVEELKKKRFKKATWPEKDRWGREIEDAERPEVTYYVNDGVWHDLEVFVVKLIPNPFYDKSANQLKQSVEIQGRDWVNGEDVTLQSHYCRLMPGDYLDILEHME